METREQKLLKEIIWAVDILNDYLNADTQEERDYLYKDIEHVAHRLSAAAEEK
jgi:hypothetical protein